MVHRTAGSSGGSDMSPTVIAFKTMSDIAGAGACRVWTTSGGWEGSASIWIASRRASPVSIDAARTRRGSASAGPPSTRRAERGATALWGGACWGARSSSLPDGGTAGATAFRTTAVSGARSAGLVHMNNASATTAVAAAANPRRGTLHGVRRLSASRSSTRRRKPGRGSALMISRTARSMAASASSESRCGLVSSMPYRRHLLFEHPAGFRDTPLDGPHGHAKDVADLLVRVVAGPCQEQRIAKLAGQRPNEHLERVLQLRSGNILFLRPCVSGHFLDPVPGITFGFRRRDGQAQPPRHALAPVERFAPGDRQQPRAERGFSSEAPELSVRHHERILSHVVSLRCRAQRRQRGPKDRSSVALDQFSERLGVPSLRPADQVEVGSLWGLGSGHTVSRLCCLLHSWKKKCRVGLAGSTGYTFVFE